MERVATLGGDSSPLSLKRTSLVGVDSKGRYVVGPTYSRGELALFDGSGHFIRAFGREGVGPGEFTGGINIIFITNDDSVHVIEDNRHTTIGPGLAGLGSTRQIPFTPRSITALPDGQWIMQYLPFGARSTDQPLHLIDARGTVVKSFGSDGVALRRDDLGETVRILAAAGDDAFWAARINEYRLDRWSRTGRLQETVVRDADWFPRWSGENPGEPLSVPPRPRIASVRQDSHGRLWVSSVVPSSKWKPQASRSIDSLDLAMVREGMLEILDLRLGRVVTTTRLAEPIRFLGQDLAYSARRSPDGDILIDIWRLTLVGYPSPRGGYY